MTMKFEEFDETTRRYMLDELDKEELGGNPYRTKRLSAVN